jgi:hypothetical protein
MPPIGLAINPAEKVKNDRIRAVVGGVDSEKNTNGNTRAAAVAYRKKSYHSILVPARAVMATLRILDFSCTSFTIPFWGVFMSLDIISSRPLFFQLLVVSDPTCRTLKHTKVLPITALI